MNQSFVPLTYYKNRLNVDNTLIETLSKKIRRLSNIRIFSFLAAFTLLFLFANHNRIIWLIFSVFFVILLVVAIAVHDKMYRHRHYVRNRIAILQNEIDAIGLNVKTYANGENYKKKLLFADDLDLFGEKSLFHLLNRCSTPEGETRLAETLTTGFFDAILIRQQQKAIAELNTKHELRIELLTCLFDSKDEIAPIKLDENTMNAAAFSSKFYHIIVWIFPVLILLSLVYLFATLQYIPMMLLGTCGFVLTLSKTAKINKLADEISGLKHRFETWAIVMQQFADENFNSERLIEMQQFAKESSTQFDHLSRISKRFDRRSNMLWAFLSNFLFLNDFILVRQLINWKKQYAKRLPLWIDTLAQLEVLLSYASFATNNPGYVYPQIAETFQLKSEQLAHPLIARQKNVKNDLQLSINPRFMLVTGSNMSGKSTWLRTVGVNVLLAQAGAPVNAKSFVWKPMKVLSSLRQSDSLSENTSLFMNELKQLKHILSEVETGKNCLVLLDEILRGTNSDDKYSGSYALVKRLTQTNSIVLMATHDLKLSELEQELPNELINYCFESVLENKELTFDYKIRKGVAVNRNATWLMKKMEII